MSAAKSDTTTTEMNAAKSDTTTTKISVGMLSPLFHYAHDDKSQDAVDH
jgi:hypothetical protein